MKDQDKNEKANGNVTTESQVLEQLPKTAINTLESWYDEDFEILNDFIETISEVICDIVLYDEAEPGTPEINLKMRKLSHLRSHLQTFQIQNKFRLENQYNKKS